MKKVVVLLGVLVLTGCATSLPIHLTNADYGRLAVQRIGVQECAVKGWMSSDVAAYGISQVNELEARVALDPIKQQGAYEEAMKNLYLLTAETCKRWEVGILATKQRQEVQADNARYQRAEMQRLADKMAAPSGRVFCNNIAGVVLCNSN